MPGGDRSVRVARALPIVGVLASYRRAWLIRDAMLALLTGAMLILAGVLRLGFLADFFSRPCYSGP